ncbi:BBF_collapsed_G0048860.mRNA.1.CDS.1 [Saccharomyces cerevisiae]|nr:BBF_collapsed_G0048860.mRNA.1.CDS.1 [Saccharomyces cerevisiae]
MVWDDYVFSLTVGIIRNYFLLNLNIQWPLFPRMCLSLVGAIERNISSQYYITSAIYLQCYAERLACPPFQSFLLHLYTDREKFEQPHGERVGK